MVGRIAGVITVLNLATQILLETLGGFTTSELGWRNYLFAPFGMYIMISGMFTIVAIVLLVINGIRKRKVEMIDMVMLIADMQHMIYFVNFMAQQ